MSNTAGAALWVIDYTLFASTIGISELYYHEGVGFKYNFVSSFGKPTHVMIPHADWLVDATRNAQPLHYQWERTRSSGAPAYHADLLRRPRR